MATATLTATDVGLFTEKSEVVVTHQSTTDLREKLKTKLHKMVQPEEDIIDVHAEVVADQ